jgi:hypothetical protein
MIWRRMIRAVSSCDLGPQECYSGGRLDGFLLAFGSSCVLYPHAFACYPPLLLMIRCVHVQHRCLFCCCSHVPCRKDMVQK